MNDDQPNFQNCAHCNVRLFANAASDLCKRCRYQGHREFSDCDKCPKTENSVYKSSASLIAGKSAGGA